MSRHGYSDDIDDNLQLGRWRGQVESAINGKRGQAFLHQLLAALDAMPQKRLVASKFEDHGQFCTLGVIAHARGVNLGALDPDDDCVGHEIGPALGIASQLAQEIMWENDEFQAWSRESGREPDSPEKRWQYMRAWVAQQVSPPDRKAWVDGPLGDAKYAKAMARWKAAQP